MEVWPVMRAQMRAIYVYYDIPNTWKIRATTETLMCKNMDCYYSSESAWMLASMIAINMSNYGLTSCMVEMY
jgi:hypothetical protein